MCTPNVNIIIVTVTITRPRGRRVRGRYGIIFGKLLFAPRSRVTGGGGDWPRATSALRCAIRADVLSAVNNVCRMRAYSLEIGILVENDNNNKILIP